MNQCETRFIFRNRVRRVPVCWVAATGASPTASTLPRILRHTIFQLYLLLHSTIFFLLFLLFVLFRLRFKHFGAWPWVLQEFRYFHVTVDCICPFIKGVRFLLYHNSSHHWIRELHWLLLHDHRFRF